MDYNPRHEWNITLLIILLYLSTILVLSHTSLLQTVESLDHDRPYYTGELQNLLLGKETTLMYTEFRPLSPALSIIISDLLNVDYSQSMLVITMIFGILTIILLRRIYGKQSWLSIAYIFTPIIMTYSVTYFIEISNYFFIFTIFYFMYYKILKKNTNDRSKGKDVWWLALAIFLGILNKEMVLYYVILLILLIPLFKYKIGRKDISIILSATLISYIAVLLIPHLLLPGMSMINGSDKLGSLIYNMKNIFQFEWYKIVPSMLLAYGSFWALIAIGFFLSDNKTRWEAIYFSIAALPIFFSLFPSPKYFFTITAPYFFLLMNEGLSSIDDKV